MSLFKKKKVRASLRASRSVKQALIVFFRFSPPKTLLSPYLYELEIDGGPCLPN